jgi:hypothetical protein
VNRQVHLDSRTTGIPQDEHFTFVESGGCAGSSAISQLVARQDKSLARQSKICLAQASMGWRSRFATITLAERPHAPRADAGAIVDISSRLPQCREKRADGTAGESR